MRDAIEHALRELHILLAMEAMFQVMEHDRRATSGLPTIGEDEMRRILLLHMGSLTGRERQRVVLSLQKHADDDHITV